MPHLGGDFHPAQKNHPRVRRQRRDLAQIPGVIVLGDTDRADPDRVRASDHVVRREVGIGAAAIGMQMEVNREVGPARWGCPLPESIICVAPRLFGRLRGERDLLDVIADFDLIDHVHALNDAAEDSVLAVEKRRLGEANVELAAAGFALRVDLIALARHRERTAQMFLGRADLGGNRVARSAHPVTLRVAALNHEARLDAMERQVVVEAVLRELLEIGDGLGRDGGIKLNN